MRLAVVCLLACAGLAHAQPAARVAHLDQALAELKTHASTLDREIYEAVRTRCKPATLACMIAIARERCGKASACSAAADVIVTNQHAERDLLDEQTRMRLVRTSSDYHQAVLAELRGRFAVLAAELALARATGTLGAQIDRLCVERDRVARRCVPDEPACIGTIAYQRCAAGLVWFVSTEKEPAR